MNCPLYGQQRLEAAQFGPWLRAKSVIRRRVVKEGRNFNPMGQVSQGDVHLSQQDRESSERQGPEPMRNADKETVLKKGKGVSLGEDKGEDDHVRNQALMKEPDKVEEEGRDRVILDFFKSLFTASNQTASLNFLNGLARRITDDMNASLTQEFKAEEVTQPLNQMSPTKAPGPDCMAPLFFRKYWDVVGKDVIVAILNVLNSDVISLSQSAFVPGRLIIDNVLVAYELVHFLRQKSYGKKGYMSLKLDIKGPILASRGLRQGDLLSPCLFLMCTKGLVTLMQQADQHMMVEGIKICKGAPKINHLLFAYDSLIFCRATMQSNIKIQHLLEIYEKASGQKVNKEKTSMVFSKNVAAGQPELIMNFWGVQRHQQ
ncbi:uncharacterized protein LOC121267314 [Juglans microcarpa x Juglans regia]|uniref:uncharacterized protein LOC121267314 n=1 Tax=Juglans microcarpa x Juglans regia TaxID=2249226 RepID=UPI001B7E31E3|nr:uncharacterized protein LOC121267314 [Juglans microcarpa x Juglans regia]